ncbi:phage/plasmid primase, P4 family [Edaphovirga cremea]|uniref:DNA primase family protein n=1 Tax=Edaphovirga cremea TaxID=2267246 RepID=UPI00398A00BA
MSLEKMAPSECAKKYLEQSEPLTVHLTSNIVFEYRDGVWNCLKDAELLRRVAEFFNSNGAVYRPDKIKSVVEAMKMEMHERGAAQAGLIGFKNGVYDLNNRQFLAHKQEHWLLNHNGIEYLDPESLEVLETHAPNFYQWLSHCANADEGKMERIKAALYMVLTNRHDWQMFIEITGAGGSGKSIFMDIASLLVGEDNAVSGSMANLDDGRGRARFVGKTLIMLPDQPRYFGDGAGIKAITGGDPVDIDAKYKNPYTIVLNAVVIATNNAPMHFNEKNGGISRRRVIFSFDQVVQNRDLELKSKIRIELPVIIRHLLDDFSDEGKARRFLTKQLHSSESMKVKCGTDPMYAFCSYLKELPEYTGLLMGNLNISPEKPRMYLYHAYLSFMGANGFGKPLTLTRFGNDLPSVLKEFSINARKAKTKYGMRYNLALADAANDWLPSVPANDKRE